MNPTIDGTGFGYITVEGLRIENDIVIALSGKITKRKKKLSKAIHGTSHIVSRDEADHIYEDRAERIIIGSGQYGKLSLSQEASQYFKKRNCVVELLPTPEAIEHWNEAKGSVIGLFHVTC
jgi:hypothetical protein